MGINPSYSWRTILGSRSLLEKGVRWKVRVGNSIKVWKDGWIGGNGTGKLITPVRILDKEATIASLLDNDRHQWRRDIISDVFFPIDAERILNIPIGSSRDADARAWVASSDGIFKVREMYALARDHYNNGECSSGSDPIWKKMWGFQIQPKGKIFLWRALWDILPHGSNLRKKGIDNAGKCCRCGMEESNNHVLRDCFWARKVWQKFPVNLDFPQQHVSIQEWMGMILQHHKQ